MNLRPSEYEVGALTRRLRSVRGTTLARTSILHIHRSENMDCHLLGVVCLRQSKGRGKVHPRTGLGGPEGSRCLAVLFL